MLRYTYIAYLVEHNLQYLVAIAPSPPNVKNCIVVYVELSQEQFDGQFQCSR